MFRDHFDVVIIGAGLSGIGAGYRLQTRCPRKRYIIFETRAEIGGTWDLFRFPGVRSDSDMFTFAYPFRPWKGTKVIADGHVILEYLRETAREFGIDRHIRFQHRVLSASWSSEDARWLLEIRTLRNGETVQCTCDFLYGCTGYYRYEAGHEPAFPGFGRFRGRFVHPQHWPEDLDYAGKRVVVIGSGATAVTMVPAISRTAAHVTMLQRSPSYTLSLPTEDPVANLLRRFLPVDAAYRIARWKNIWISIGIYQICRRAPEIARRLLRQGAAKTLPRNYEIDMHFNPRYQPWDQRLCIVPDSDLFRSISEGSVSVVTGRIDTFTEHGLRLESGEPLEADIIVAATGLQMLALGGVHVAVDGTPVDPGRMFVYKGAMLSNIPNFAFSMHGLYQCVVDASRGFDIDLRLPPAESHGPARLSDLQACMRSRIDAGQAFAQSHLRLCRKGGRKPAKTRGGKALARSPELYSRLVHHEIEPDGRWHSKVWVIPPRHSK